MLIKLTHAHVIGTVIAYLIGVCLVPLVISFSKKEGLVDVPNERKIHTKPISRIGGVAIWASTMLTFLCLVFMSYYPYGSLLSGILLGGSLMFLLGLVDDIYNLDAKFKLFLQISIATLVYLLGVQINNIPFIGDIGIFSYPITLLWIVGISNALNFSALIGFILAGSMLAFLTYNFNPAKIFMGDSGALFSGFLLATISITGVMKAATLAILLPFLVLAVPIMDITFSSLRRIAKGKSPFVADAEHIHHKLLHAGFSQKKTVVILSSVAIIAGALASLFMGSQTIKHYFIYILAIVVIMLLLNFIKVLTKK